jgi:hypothetical protein
MAKWLYTCLNCGCQVNAGSDFAGNCPVCHGARWLCHLLDRDSSKGEISLGQAVDPVKTPPTNLSQPFDKPGPKPDPLLRDLVSQFSSQGLSSRKIAEEISWRGTAVSYRTVARLLAEHKQRGNKPNG